MKKNEEKKDTVMREKRSKEIQRKKENRKCETAKNQNKEKHIFLVAVKM